MKHRTVKIWKTEAEILEAIDGARALATRLANECRELDEECKAKAGELEKLRFEAMNLRDDQLRNAERRIHNAKLSLDKSKEQAAKTAKSYHRTVEKTLPRLKEVLAAFRTGTFKEVLDEYEGVAVK